MSAFNVGSSTDPYSVAKVNSTPDGLEQLLTEVTASDKPIPVEFLARLITSPELSQSQRHSVLNNASLRHTFSKRVKPEEALFLMASLLIGSHQWDEKTDYGTFYPHSKDPVYDPVKTLGCTELLTYASFLTGLASKEKIFKYQKRGMLRLLKEFSKCSDMIKLTKLHEEATVKGATNFGFKLKGKSSQLDLEEKVEKFSVKVFFSREKQDPEYFHYGIVGFFPYDNTLTLHISEETKQVAAQPVDIVPELNPTAFTIYKGKLPWLSRKIFPF